MVSALGRNAMSDDTEMLDRQVVRGQMHVHTALGEHAERLDETNGLLHGVIDVLLAKGAVTEQEIALATAAVRNEMRKRDAPGHAAVAIRGANGPAPPPVAVDCSRRLPICKAVCCKLDFALSVEEIESGGIKWDLGRPYFVRHKPDGYCAHQDQHRGCTIYQGRPGVCRQYSCAKDARIWKNFEALELNTEWIEQNVGRDRNPVMTRLLMHDPSDLTPVVAKP
jgi:Fe-S-cluster containining protein